VKNYPEKLISSDALAALRALQQRALITKQPSRQASAT
jgi:hypothetical protein